MKKGLILEGGALRGLFTAGVLDVLMENKIDFDGMIGVSAGAAFGCNYKSHQIGRVLRYNKRFVNDWRYCSLKSLIKTGDLFNAEYDYHIIPEKLDSFDGKAFDENPMKFYAVCTNVETGKPVYKLLMKHGYNFNEWIRASSSMPLAARIVEIDGLKLLDGGISDSIPLKFFQSKGYTKNVVILTQTYDYIKKPNPLTSLFRLQLNKYPAFLHAAKVRPAMYNQQLKYVKEQEDAGTAFVIRPSKKLPVNHITHNVHLMDEMYQSGRKIMQSKLHELKNFLIE